MVEVSLHWGSGGFRKEVNTYTRPLGVHLFGEEDFLLVRKKKKIDGRQQRGVCVDKGKFFSAYM